MYRKTAIGIQRNSQQMSLINSRGKKGGIYLILRLRDYREGPSTRSGELDSRCDSNDVRIQDVLDCYGKQ
jgi:hypothetical protein